MAIFDFLKKKKKQLPLPPPPRPSGVRGDLAPIRPRQQPMPASGLPSSLPSFNTMPPALPAPTNLHEDIPELPMLPNESNTPSSTPTWSQAPKKPAPLVKQTSSQLNSNTPQFLPKHEPAHHEIRDKSFVAVDDYRMIISQSNGIRQRLVNADSYVKKLLEIRQTEQRVLKQWHSQLENVEKKLSYVDELIEQAQR